MKAVGMNIVAIAAASLALTFCSKEQTSEYEASLNDGDITVTITASNPEGIPDTKTEIEGTTPYWSAGDEIGVVADNKNLKFTSGLTQKARTASFTGTASSGSKAYAYHPYNDFGLSDGNAVTVIPKIQYPSATSFDGNADILLSKEFTITSNTVEGLEFQRFSAVVKIVFVDKTSKGALTGQHPTLVSFTSDEAMTGRVRFTNNDQSLYNLVNTSKTIQASYTSDTKFDLGGDGAVWMISYPRELAEGSELSFAAYTEDYYISKTVTLPRAVELAAGKITTLKVSVTDDNLGDNNTLHLPFEDDMAWATKGSGNDNSTVQTVETTTVSDANGNKLYSDMSAVRKGVEGLKFATVSSSIDGTPGSYSKSYITTGVVDLSGDYSVIITGKNHPTYSDMTKYQPASVDVIVDDVTKETITLASAFKTFTIPLDAATESSKIKFNVTNCAYVSEIKIVNGKKARIDTEGDTVPAEGGTISFATISNANSCEATVYTDEAHTQTCSWLSASASVSGVNLIATENTTGEIRQAYVVITAGNAKTDDSSVEVAISQDPAGHYVKVTEAPDDWTGDYIIVYGNQVMTSIQDPKSPANYTSDLITVTGNEIATSRLKYNLRVEQYVDDTYSLYIADSGYLNHAGSRYSLSKSSTLPASSNSSSNYYRWKISATGDGLFKILNSSTSYYIGHSESSSGSFTMSNSKAPYVELYKLKD